MQAPSENREKGSLHPIISSTNPRESTNQLVKNVETLKLWVPLNVQHPAISGFRLWSENIIHRCLSQAQTDDLSFL